MKDTFEDKTRKIYAQREKVNSGEISSVLTENARFPLSKC